MFIDFSGITNMCYVWSISNKLSRGVIEMHLKTRLVVGVLILVFFPCTYCYWLGLRDPFPL